MSLSVLALIVRIVAIQSLLFAGVSKSPPVSTIWSLDSIKKFNYVSVKPLAAKANEISSTNIFTTNNCCCREFFSTRISDRRDFLDILYINSFLTPLNSCIATIVICARKNVYQFFCFFATNVRSFRTRCPSLRYVKLLGLTGVEWRCTHEQGESLERKDYWRGLAGFTRGAPGRGVLSVYNL